MVELIDKKNLFNNLFVRNGKVCPNNDIDNFPTTIDVKEVKKAILEQPTVTEAEIREMVEHTYENCHNITCRRKCQKDGYNMAIDEAMEKLAEEICTGCGCLKDRKCTYKGSNCRVSKIMLEKTMKVLEKLKE